MTYIYYERGITRVLRPLNAPNQVSFVWRLKWKTWKTQKDSQAWNLERVKLCDKRTNIQMLSEEQALELVFMSGL